MKHTEIQKDLLASIVVFLVALPLCMGIAIASGFPPAAGLITGIIGGMVVGLLAGSPLQVSGPAAGLSVFVWQLLEAHGMEKLSWIILFAGCIQVLAASLRLGLWFRAVSPAVLQGMLAGIGFLILASQFYILVDLQPLGSGVSNLKGVVPTLSGLFFTPTGAQGSLGALGIGLLTIGSIIVWNRFRPKRLAFIPGALVGVVLATLCVAVFSMSLKFVGIPENLAAEVKFLSLNVFGEVGGLWPVVQAGIGLAFVASAESLLCASAIDEMHSGPKTQFNKELFAQGVGNSLCGALGALPMTGVIVRSSANVLAGGQTRWSAVLHGFWILLFVVALPFVLRAIPLASLAGVLVFTGFKLLDLKQAKAMMEEGKSELAVYLVTLGGVVLIDLLSGVILGSVAALARLLIKVARLDSQVSTDNQTTVVKLKGCATFLHIPKLAKTLERFTKDQRVRIDAAELTFIDAAAERLLMFWHKDRGLSFESIRRRSERKSEAKVGRTAA